MPEHRNIPTNRLGRLARMASLGVRTGVQLIADRDAQNHALHAAQVLGTMRGIAAKLGQMASYVDGLVPEAHREAYEGAMASLRAQTPTSSFEQVRQVLESELGAPLESLFAEMDPTPVASASIGQVHRAVTKDGHEVAVKVQHPSVELAVEGDLANAAFLENIAGTLAGKRFDTKAMLETMRARFREELDYTLEAERTETFARIHGEDAAMVIPQVFRTHTSKRVLTTQFIRGMHFDEACSQSPTLRRTWAETLWRFVYRGNLVGGMFNADPHPGNYIFLEDGRVAFLDFGCVQPLSPRRLQVARALHWAARQRDEAQFRRMVSKMVQTKPGRLETMAQEYTRHCFDPIFCAPFRITKSYAAGLMDAMKVMGAEARSMTDDEFFTMPPEMLFINRLQFGFYSVLARLDVEADYASQEVVILDEIGLTDEIYAIAENIDVES